MLAGRRIGDARRLRVEHGGAVAERPDVLLAFDAEGLVHPDATALVERKPELREQGARLHSCRPDQRSRRDARAVREDGLAAVVGLERRPDVDLHTAALEMASGVLAEPARDLREDLRRGVDEHPALGDTLERGVVAQRGVREVVELAERLHARVAGADEDEPELVGSVGVDRRTLELVQHAVAQRDCVREVLEADPVLAQPGHRESARDSAQRDHQALVGDLDRSRERLGHDDPAVAVEPGDAAEQQLRVRAHLTERHDDVARLERPRARFGQQRRVEHVVLERDDRRAARPVQARDVAPGEPAAEDQRPAARLASLHRSCLPRWRPRCRSSGAGRSGRARPRRSAGFSRSAAARS